MKIRTPKQLEEWSFSINNSDNTIEDSNKIEDEKNATLIIEEEKENEESLYEECLQEENLGEEILQEEIIHEESCNIKCKVRSVQKRIKVLEADMEKSDYSVELIKTKVDLHEQMLKQIIFLQQKCFNMASAQNKSSEHKMALLKMQKQKEILEQSKSSLQNIVVLQTERIGNLEEKIGIVADERKELCERLNKAERELSAMTKEKIGIVADEQKELYERLNKAERELSAMTNKLAYFSNLKVKFIKFENKWGYVADTFFAEQKKIIHDNMFDGKVGSLYVNPDGKLEYKASESAKKVKNMIRVYGQNKFNKSATDPLFHSIYYFEVEFKNIGEVNERGETALIGIDGSPIITLASCLMSDKKTKNITISVLGKTKKIRHTNMFWKDGDVCGTGLVFPKEDNADQRPYVFFTINGKLFGKALFLEETSDKFRPLFGFLSGSVQTNFGEDLMLKPFSYNVSKHTMPEGFYEEKDFS